jgi:hypothetical protein
VSFGVTSHKNQQCVPHLLESSNAYKDEGGVIRKGKYSGEPNDKIVQYSEYLEYEEGCGSILDEATLEGEFRKDLEYKFNEKCID